MKAFIQLILITLYLFFFGLAPANAASTQFEAGVHYVEVDGTQSKTPQVTEFFSFYCPACYRSEPFMAEIKTMLPEPSAFNKVHVDGMPGRNVDIEHELTKALIAAELLNVEDKVVAAIFKYIHQGRANFSTAKDVKNLFVLHGVNGKEFDRVIKSFKVKATANKMRKDTEAIRKQGHSSVPTLIINNKYKPDVKQISSMAEYKALVAFLLTKTA